MRLNIPVLASLSTLLLLGPRVATASEVFPEAVAAAVPSLTCVPQCTLCHATLAGGVADKPFAMNLKMAKAVIPRDTASLQAALTALQGLPASDADKDGRGDYAELAASEDPNSSAAGATLCTGGPVYGCGATMARTPSNGMSSGPNGGHAITLALAVLASAWVLRRKR